ncbi:MAG: hypothetical protein OHK0023_05050 [Anaerolineae bacterium]
MLGWLITRITHLPHSNPVWRWELRKHGAKIEHLKRRSGWGLFILSGFTMVISLCNWQSDYGSDALIFVILPLGFLVSLVLMLGTDFSYAAAAFNSLTAYRSYGDWDLLALTELRPNQILNAKYSTALIRGWRTLILEWSVRLVTATMLFGLVLRQFLQYPSSRGDLSILIVVLVLGAGYLAEPYWRMRTLTAFGIALSAARLDQTQTTALTVGAVIGLRLLQLVYFLLVVALFNWYSSFGSRYFFGGDSFSIAFSISLMVGAAWLGSYLIYMMLQRMAFRFAERRIFKAEI